jgi:outer membrane protease
MRHFCWKLAVMIVFGAFAAIARAETINARIVDGPNTNVIEPAALVPPVAPVAPVPTIPPVAKEGITAQLWGGVGAMGGDVTYEIGGDYTASDGSFGTVNSPLSRLKWPVNVLSATVGGSLTAARFWELNARWSGSISSDAGKLEDSDWELAFNPRLKTTYSESDADLNAMTADVGLRCWALNWVLNPQTDYSVGFGAGWLYQDFRWDASNVDQQDMLSPYPNRTMTPGLAATYKVDLSMPYLDIACQMRVPWLSFFGSLGYSPIAQLHDEDDHKLRTLLAKTSADGNAFKLTLQGRCDYNAHVFAVVRADLLTYDVSGTMHKTVYEGADRGDWVTVHNNITSVQDNVTVAIGVKF